jgi:hypothetical protein
MKCFAETTKRTTNPSSPKLQKKLDKKSFRGNDGSVLNKPPGGTSK